VISLILCNPVWAYEALQIGHAGRALKLRTGSSQCNYSGMALAWSNFSNKSLTGCDFSNADLTGANFSYSILDGANFTSAILASANLQSSVLTNANFVNAYATNANFRWADLTGANLSNATVNGGHFYGSVAPGISLVGASMVGVDFCSGIANTYCQGQQPLFQGNLPGANLQGFDFTNFAPVGNLAGANLTGSNLSSKDLTNSVFTGATLTSANLSRSKLTNANFASADLANADLSRTDISQADFSSANLSGASLFSSVMTGVNLAKANLSNVNLGLANASNLDLSGIDLQSVNLAWANLSGANLSGTKLAGANLTGANLSRVFMYPLATGTFVGSPTSLSCGLKVVAGAFAGAMCQTSVPNAFYSSSPGMGRVGEPVSILSPEPSSTVWKYQWVSLVTTGGYGVDHEIVGAVGSTYIPTADEIGHGLACFVTRVIPGYIDETIMVLGSKVVEGNLPGTSMPLIDGSKAVGSTLTAVGVSSLDGIALSYKWYREDTQVDGASSSSYLVTQADAGHHITVQVTRSKTGYITDFYGSVPTFIPLSKLKLIPVPLVEPRPIVGTLISANPGTWDAGVGLSFQWLLDGAPIAGASSGSYTPQPNDCGHQLSVSVTGSSVGFMSSTQTSLEALVGPGNQINTPVPSLVGVSNVGSILTAVAGVWDSGVALTYQWLRDGIPIAGAISATYELTSADYSHQVSVSVTGSSTGYISSTQTSSASTVTLGAMVRTPVPVVSGGAAVSSTLTVNPGVWDPGVTLSYQWLRDGIPIAGAISATYELTSADYSHQVSVSVTGSSTGYISSTQTSSASTVALGNQANTPVPVVSGSVAVGSTLTANPGIWDLGVTLSYQWLRDGLPISGATSATYKILISDLGSSIALKVTGSAAGFNPKSLTSGPTVVAFGSFSRTPTPTVSGQVKVGSTLTAGSGVWDSGVSLSYQWLRDGSPISGATSATYVLVGSDFSHQVSVSVTGSSIGYTSSTQTSSASAVTQGTMISTPVPVVSGSAAVSSTLTVNPGVWDPGVTLSYQWLRDGLPISGATLQTYQLIPADLGQLVSVRAIGSAEGYSSVSKISSASTVQAHAMTFTPVPTVTGQAKVGSSLTAVAGVWDSGVTLSYQWLRDGLPISGATSAIYQVQVGDFSHLVSVQVSGTATGYAPASQFSTADAVLPAGLSSTPKPSITGSTTVGSPLTVVPGVWEPGVTLSYQWLRDGSPIGGATSATYVLVGSDYAHQVSVSVTGAATGYTSSTQTSSASTVTLGTMVSTPVPVVSGSAAVSSTLTVNPGVWDPGVTLSYQWLRDGSPISGATSQTYQLIPADLGRLVSVQVTGFAEGYSSISKISSASTVQAHAMTFTPVPAVTGQVKVGSSLTVMPGVWDSGVSLMYQWLRDGSPISGATNATYQVQVADSSHLLSVQVSGIATGYATVSQSSTPQTVQPGQLSSIKVLVTGKFSVGQTVSAKSSGLTMLATISYQWLMDGKKITGAKTSKFKITKAQLKHKISVNITESLSGYLDAVVTSTGVKVS
jgi:uncharacterized protein YjbI with pentapeptide repeats